MCHVFPAERDGDDQGGFWSESDLYQRPQTWRLQQKVLIISSLHFGKIMCKTVAGHASKGNYLGTEIIDWFISSALIEALRQIIIPIHLGKGKVFFPAEWPLTT